MCWHKSFWRGTKCSQIFGLAQKIWPGTKNFGTGKRTRRKNSKNLWNHCGQSLSHAILTKLHTILHIFKHKSLYDKTKNKLVLIKILTTKILNLLSVSSHFGNFIFGCFGRWSYQNIMYLFVYFSFCLAHLALQMENIIQKITQLKWWKNQKQSYQNM